MKTKFTKEDGITQEDREYVDGYKTPYTQRHYSEEIVLAVVEGLKEGFMDICQVYPSGCELCKFFNDRDKTCSIKIALDFAVEEIKPVEELKVKK